MRKDRVSRASRIVLSALLIAAILVGVFLMKYAYRHYLTVAYPRHYATEVAAASSEFGIHPSLIYAIIHTESHFDPDALSPAQAKGLMQLTDDTYAWAIQRENRAADSNPQNLYNPATNIRYGTYVLTLLGEQFDDPITVLAAYNAGQGHVKSWLADPRYSDDGVTLKDIPFEETRHYVQRVQQAKDYYEHLYY